MSFVNQLYNAMEAYVKIKWKTLNYNVKENRRQLAKYRGSPLEVL